MEFVHNATIVSGAAAAARETLVRQIIARENFTEGLWTIYVHATEQKCMEFSCEKHYVGVCLGQQPHNGYTVGI